MDGQEEEGLDGSSIKPVSSLRSHFEQMSKPGTRTTVVPPRPLSPKPPSHGATTSTTNHLKNGSLQPSPPSQPLQVSGSSSRYRSPTRQTLPGQTPSSGLFASPVVTVEPPKSPPKSAPKTLGIHIPPRSPSPLLTGDAMARSGASSPRHSRPHTPLTETSKLARVSMSLPPEPPPPRRSGEMRRETAPKPIMGPPPPVNRAEKPRIPASKPIHSSDTTKLTTSTHRPEDGQTSPFGTPPSEESSPIAEPIPVRAVTHRLNMTQPRSRSTTPIASSEVPPAHKLIVPPSRGPEHGQASKRLSASPQPSGDHVEDRPALPVRPSLNTSISAPMRGNGDGMLFTRTHTTPVKATLSKNGTLTTSQAESVTSGPVLPRRNFSHPNTPAPTTPRTHGRSMTVDQTNDRSLAPLWAEASTHRAPQPDRPVDSRLALAESDSNMVYSSSEYPDSSLSNRRPPHFKSHSQEIATRFDARIFDVCGDFVCTSGQYTRVWGLQDGEQIISLAHGESIKISSLSFKPASNPDEEGFCLWLGNNVGELIEVDIRSQSGIVASNTSSHNRRDIYRIHRNKRELWTLDESGTLHVWSMDDAKASSLESPSASYRIPRGQGFSMVVRDELWHALGFDIRVFAPTSNGKSRFQVLQKPLSRPETGAITAGTTLGSEQQQVYFGHADGKVSIYSSENYSCLGVVVASMYKITALAGVGDFLWAAYPTGLIYVYDTTQRPWVVKKDWRAHLNPVIGLIADRSSFWRLGRSQVISLGADNCLKTWDGLLEDDWLETELHIRDEDFCQLETIKTLVFTWNAGASTPHSLRYADEDRSFFPALLKDSGSPDILVFGFQELVDLEDKKKTAKSIFSKSKKKDPYEQEYMSHQYRDWQDYIIQCLDESIPGDEIYHLLHSTSLVGLFTCVFVRGGLRDRISALSAGEVKRGFGGRAGNKGALLVRFKVDDTSFCLVNCHLAAGQNQTKERNTDISSILDSQVLPVEGVEEKRLDSYVAGGDGSMILDHEICILSGDLNYRIDTMSRDAVINTIRAGNLEKLLDRDQLLTSKRRRPGFRLRAFHEMPITFAPTYKYDVGSDTYDTSEKKRAPAWCDRILARAGDRRRLQQLTYRRHEVRVSDHRPVTGLFQMTIRKISRDRRAAVWEDCLRRFDEVKRKAETEAQYAYLMDVCGLDRASSEQLIRDRTTARQRRK